MKAMATDRHQAPSYPLRMPDELKEKLAHSAKMAGRSLHAELLHRLNGSFDALRRKAEYTRVLMELAECRVKSSQHIGEALMLAQAVEHLRFALEHPDPKMIFEEMRSYLDDAVALLVARVQAYEGQFDPRGRLDEYRKAIEEAESQLEHWRTWWKGPVPSRPNYPFVDAPDGDTGDGGEQPKHDG